MGYNFDQQAVIHKAKHLSQDSVFVEHEKKVSLYVDLTVFLLSTVSVLATGVMFYLFILDSNLLQNILQTSISRILLFPFEILPLVLVPGYFVVKYIIMWKSFTVRPLIAGATLSAILIFFVSNYVTLLNETPLRQLAFNTIKSTTNSTDFGSISLLEKVSDGKYLATITLNNTSKIYKMNNPKIIPAVGAQIWLTYTDDTITDMGVISTNKIF
jgi:hypothetical protein